MKKVLVASPVRQKPAILKEFLWSLAHLDTTGMTVSYAFVDDHPEECRLLRDFAAGRDNVQILPGDRPGDIYHCTEQTHHWREDLIWKVAGYKNRFLQMAREGGYDYLFLVDSDLVLHPRTLVHLAGLDKDIVAEVFWTRWQPDLPPLPQVWVGDQYRLHPMQRGEELGVGEVARRREEFLAMLRQPGTYRVGGLGACTLISRRAMLMGVSFSEIYNLGFTGEDRHFCIRAAALGLELYADTHYPPYHIYRESDLAGLAAYKEHFFRRQPAPGQDQHPFLPTYGELFLAGGGKNNGHIPPVTEIAPCPSPSGGRTFPEGYCSSVRDGGERVTAFCTSSDCYIPETKDPGPAAGIRATPAHLPSGCPANGANTAGLRNGTITLAMLVRNETGRYLERVLKHASQYIQQAVILDDASEDGSPEVCRRVLENVPLTLVCNREPSFNNEILLRKQLWELAAATAPDWVLILDADEIFEDRAVGELPLLAADPAVEVYYFRLCDMWDENHYREDDYWRAHLIYRPFMVRYIPGFPWQWQETPLHCGRFPRNVTELKGAKSHLRIKHLGWMKPADRLARYYRYKKLDPRGQYGLMQQYLSILDPKPNLVPWVEN